MNRIIMTTFTSRVRGTTESREKKQLNRRGIRQLYNTRTIEMWNFEVRTRNKYYSKIKQPSLHMRHISLRMNNGTNKCRKISMKQHSVLTMCDKKNSKSAKNSCVSSSTKLILDETLSLN